MRSFICRICCWGFSASLPILNSSKSLFPFSLFLSAHNDGLKLNLNVSVVLFFYFSSRFSFCFVSLTLKLNSNKFAFLKLGKRPKVSFSFFFASFSFLILLDTRVFVFRKFFNSLKSTWNGKVSMLHINVVNLFSFPQFH